MKRVFVLLQKLVGVVGNISSKVLDEEALLGEAVLGEELGLDLFHVWAEYGERRAMRKFWEEG